MHGLIFSWGCVVDYLSEEERPEGTSDNCVPAYRYSGHI